MIDMHTHLDLYPNAMDIIQRVNHSNQFTLAVTTSPRAWVATSKVFTGLNNIKVAVGLHPEIVEKKYSEFEMLLEYIKQAEFVGEVGLDGSSRFKSSFKKQEQVFEATLQECKKVGGRILSIHSRAAAGNVLSFFEKYPDCGTMILHWFSGTISELNKAIQLKCFFSVNPLMIESARGKELVSRIPKELIIPESDGPFAARNGSPIMPWEAISICKNLSHIWSVTEEDAIARMKHNLDHLIRSETP